VAEENRRELEPQLSDNPSTAMGCPWEQTRQFFKRKIASAGLEKQGPCWAFFILSPIKSVKKI